MYNTLQIISEISANRLQRADEYRSNLEHGEYFQVKYMQTQICHTQKMGFNWTLLLTPFRAYLTGV